ncbi:hypothetical protein KIW84_045955 [Lathyrus oleraceus]|uniref:Uncharacterized protein n=1 Tax=Pisum sativum TaxID=3888 RepID=A0A9D4XLI9_PEA|nr:hypothetical protein KIW84_045955 [Pisum sativum]
MNDRNNKRTPATEMKPVRNAQKEPITRSRFHSDTLARLLFPRSQLLFKRRRDEALGFSPKTPPPGDKDITDVTTGTGLVLGYVFHCDLAPLLPQLALLLQSNIWSDRVSIVTAGGFANMIQVSVCYWVLSFGQNWHESNLVITFCNRSELGKVMACSRLGIQCGTVMGWQDKQGSWLGLATNVLKGEWCWSDDNLHHLDEVVQRNDEKRETIRRLQLEVETLKHENQALQNSSRDSNADSECSQSQISRPGRTSVSKFFRGCSP